MINIGMDLESVFMRMGEFMKEHGRRINGTEKVMNASAMETNT